MWRPPPKFHDERDILPVREFPAQVRVRTATQP